MIPVAPVAGPILGPILGAVGLGSLALPFAGMNPQSGIFDPSGHYPGERVEGLQNWVWMPNSRTGKLGWGTVQQFIESQPPLNPLQEAWYNQWLALGVDALEAWQRAVGMSGGGPWPIEEPPPPPGETPTEPPAETIPERPPGAELPGGTEPPSPSEGANIPWPWIVLGGAAGTLVLVNSQTGEVMTTEVPNWEVTRTETDLPSPPPLPPQELPPGNVQVVPGPPAGELQPPPGYGQLPAEATFRPNWPGEIPTPVPSQIPSELQPPPAPGTPGWPGLPPTPVPSKLPSELTPPEIPGISWPFPPLEGGGGGGGPLPMGNFPVVGGGPALASLFQNFGVPRPLIPSLGQLLLGGKR